MSRLAPVAIDKGDGTIIQRCQEWQDDTWEALAAGFTSGADPLFRRLAETYLGLWRNFDALRIDHDRRREEMETALQARNQFNRALTVVADLLHEEAVNRDWCSEYGEFVDKVNAAVGYPVLTHCVKDFTVSFLVTVTVEAAKSDIATETATADLRRALGRMDNSADCTHQDTDTSD